MNAEHDEIESAVAAFLLGAADPEEVEIVQAHLDGCSSCRELARRLQRAIGAVPFAVEPISPPSRLRERILAAASASRQSERRGPQRARVLRLPRPQARSLSWVTGLRTTIAGAAIVAFALGAGLGLGIGRSIAPQPQAPTVAQFMLTGSGSMTGAQGRVFELKQDGITLVQFSGLPRLEPGRVYELWLIPKAGQPAAAGVFAPDQEGSYVAVIARNLAGLKALAVTDEAGPGGAPAPTQQPQLIGSVA